MVLPSYGRFSELKGKNAQAGSIIPYVHLIEIERLITSITDSGSPARAESELFWVILDVFRKIQAEIVAGEPFCDLEIPS